MMTRLKGNAANSFFRTHEIEYLGYILNIDVGLNPSKKRYMQ